MASAIRPIPRALSPLEAARKHCGAEGLVYLDSAQSAGQQWSLLATEPEEVLEGHLEADQDKLRALLKRHERKPHANRPGPDGGLFGWIGYDGHYMLGVYRDCELFLNTDAEIPARANSLSAPVLRFVPQIDKETFCQMVRRAQEYIAAGDIYQVNLSYPWLAAWPENYEPWAFYERLRHVSPAPYGAFMNLGGKQIFSASPECFLRMSHRHVVTQPIKGTRPRGLSAAADRRYSEELLQSPKERAELVMITDLERNDLGQVCEFGTVQVPELLKLEVHTHVHHLVSTVEGCLREGVDHLAALTACFPGGSITGAPKKRAMEIIKELEPHDRSIYTGAIGGFGFNGISQFSIAIRTAWLHDNVLRFHTGAGIVADSSPELEWEETCHKAAGLLQAAHA